MTMTKEFNKLYTDALVKLNLAKWVERHADSEHEISAMVDTEMAKNAVQDYADAAIALGVDTSELLTRNEEVKEWFELYAEIVCFFDEDEWPEEFAPLSWKYHWHKRWEDRYDFYEVIRCSQ